MSLTRKLSAEFIGTFVLVFGGCGSAVLAASFGVPVASSVVNLGIAFAGVSLAFGLTVLCMAYAVGHISGGHFNPAVTLGLVAAGRASPLDAGPYILAQVAGAVAASWVLYIVATGNGAGIGVGGFASNGYGELSPGKYSLESAAIIEVVLTAVFLIVIVGVTSVKAPKGFAPIAIGLALTLIHLVSIPVTNTSVNPARSTGVALFAESSPGATATALSQLWLFWAAPILGGIIGGLISRFLQGPQTEE